MSFLLINLYNFHLSLGLMWFVAKGLTLPTAGWSFSPRYKVPGTTIA